MAIGIALFQFKIIEETYSTLTHVYFDLANVSKSWKGALISEDANSVYKNDW